MRDLHDGLGGQLVSIVALSERGEGGAPVGDAARAALKDLRLVIDSMEDIGGDLMPIFYTWRGLTWCKPLILLTEGWRFRKSVVPRFSSI
jgi:hypothetical protein